MPCELLRCDCQETLVAGGHQVSPFQLHIAGLIQVFLNSKTTIHFKLAVTGRVVQLFAVSDFLGFRVQDSTFLSRPCSTSQSNWLRRVSLRLQCTSKSSYSFQTYSPESMVEPMKISTSRTNQPCCGGSLCKTTFSSRGVLGAARHGKCDAAGCSKSRVLKFGLQI